ncbi:MAG TPA: flavin monoamine oxidase family protein [Ktedonobacterales bacterium]
MSILTKIFGTSVQQAPTLHPAELATLVASVTELQPERHDLSTEVVVVGAGLAGLMAARTLVASSIETLVIEARDRVGGRVYTRPAADGTPLDLGGQWLGPTQRRLAALARDLGITTYKTYDTGNNIQYRDGQCHIYSGAIPTTDAIASADVIEAMLTLNMMAMQVPLDSPWTAPSAAEWDAQTLATWIAANVPSPGARELLTLGVQAIFSAEPRDLSLLHFLFYVHSAGGLMDLLAVTGGAQESRITGGAQTIANRLAEALGQRVILNSPVHTITHDNTTGVRIEGDVGTITARRAIITLPPTLAGRLRYHPALPGYRDQLTQRIPMGTVYKVQCLYPTPFWRDEGLTGQTSSDTGPVRITFDNSPEAGAPGVLLGFIEGDEARRWSRRSHEERRTAVLECFTRYFGEHAASPSEYVEHSWAEEEYTRGCYAGYMPPGVWTTFGEALRAPIGPLHWAGTETATEWNGYMEGALQSGERVAREVIAALG